MADVIEVERTDDNSTRNFNPTEITDGTLLSWVTANDANADGLVLFVNQSSGEFLPSTDSGLKGKIVKNGSLVTDANGDPVVEWDGFDDGYELDISSVDNIDSVVSQTVSFQVEPDDLNGKPQTLIESDGIRVWNRDNEIYATIADLSTGWRKWSDISGRTFPGSISFIENCISYEGNLWTKSWDGSTYDMIYWDGSSWTISNDNLSDSLNSLGVYQGDLYVTDQNNGDVHKFDGSNWTKPHSATNGYYQSFVVYEGDAYLANGTNSSVTKFDGNTWDESFLTTGDLASLDGNGNPWGMAVHEGNLYLALDDAPPSHIVRYDSTNGWQEFASVDTSTQGSAGVTSNGFMTVGSYDGTLVAGTKSGQFWTYDEQVDTWNFQGLACSYLSGFHVWNGDLYMSGRFGFYDSDGVWKWDGSTLERDLDDSEIPSGGFNGPFRFSNIWNGELLTYHRYGADNLYVKGQGREVRVPFEENDDTLYIEVGTSENNLVLNVNGNVKSKKYDFDYTRSETFEIGKNEGSVTGGVHSIMDEPYSGTLRGLKRFPKLINSLSNTVLKSSTPFISFTGSTADSISGEVSYNDPSVVQTYEILTSDSQSGTFNVSDTISNTNFGNLLKDPESWSVNGLNEDQTFYFKPRVVGKGGAEIEGSVSSFVATTTNPLNVSYDAETDAINLDWSMALDASTYEIFRSTSINGNFTKIGTVSSSRISFDDTSQTGGTFYYYVEAINNNGDRYAKSNTEMISTGLEVGLNETASLSDTTEDYSHVYINGTLSIEDKVTLNVANSFTVSPTGKIDGVGGGYQPSSGDHADGNGPGAGVGQNNDGGGGAGYGGTGGTAADAFDPTGPTYGSETTVAIQKGSSGGNGDGGSQGGAGGAALHVIPTKTDVTPFRIDGVIDVSGQNGNGQNDIRAGGGGSGGGVLFEAPVSGNGSIIAHGGGGGLPDDDSGGGGGGGRLKADRFDSTITTIVEGGDSAFDSNDGSSGTIHEFESSITEAPKNVVTSYDSNNINVDLSWDSVTNVDHYNVYRSTKFGSGYSKINGSNINSTSYTDTNISSDTTYFYFVTAVDGSDNESASSLQTMGANIKLSNDEIYHATSEGHKFNEFELSGSSTLVVSDKFAAEILNNPSVSTNSVIFGEGLGNSTPNRNLFADGTGPGAGTGLSGDGGNGAGYGGVGGLGGDRNGSGGSSYGSPTTVAIQKGSSGGSGDYGEDGYSNGGSGGSAVDISGNGVTFNLNGKINFNGKNGDGKQGTGSSQASGGGSGGGVLIQMPVEGAGEITVNGGDGGGSDNDGGGGGAGGRIKTFGLGSGLTATATGGAAPAPKASGETDGEDGTITDVS